MDGAEVSVNAINSAGGLRVLACYNQNKSNAIGIIIQNEGSSVSGQLALSRWPGKSTGSGTLTRYEVSSSNPTGNPSQVTVTNGLAQITIPGSSVVVLKA
jgi:hypothetical protein